MNIIKSIPPPQDNNCFVSIDTEFFGMNKKQMHRPNSGRFACMTVCVNDEDVYYIDRQEDVPAVLDNLNDCVWCFHNAKFDITQLRRYAEIAPRKKLWDTMLIERIMYNGYYDTFGLEDVVRRHLSIEMHKEPQKEFETATEMTPDKIEYACLDALYTRKVALEQKKHMDKDDFTVWTKIDRPALWAVMNFQGFALDKDKWIALAELNKQRQGEIDANLPFNPRSPKQVVKWFSEHGVKLESSDEEHLLKVVHKQDGIAKEVAQQILDSRMYGNRASKYGTKWIKEFLEYDKEVPVFIASYNVVGAETGRMSANDPPMQTIPIRDTTEFRECFVARPGNDLLIADYSAQEPRIMAYLSQDKNLIQIFNDGKDIYIEMAKYIFNETITKKDPRRNTMKSVVLGMNYGLSKWGLSRREGIPVDLAEEYLTKSFKMFPGVANWMKKQQGNHKYVTTVAGRKYWLNSYATQSERNSLNAPIQGTAADMFKKSVSTLYQEWNFDCPFGVVAVVHDELVLDVPKHLSKQISKLLSDIMVQTAEEMCPGVPFKADVAIGSRWSEKS